MSAAEAEPLSLEGKQVAFTGKLATMTLAEAAELVQSRGGRLGRQVGRDTAVLVVGQEGLPLTRKGGLTAKLEKAHKLQDAGELLILSEDDFFTRLGLMGQATDVRRLYNTGQLCRLLGVGRDQLRAWLRAGLIGPAATVQDVPFFDFRQATATKTLLSLARAGVTTGQVRRSLERLGRYMPGLEYPLEKLALLDRGGELLFRLENGQLAEPSGQIHFDFPAATSPATVEVATAPWTVQQLWQAGLTSETAGRLEESAEAYREALRLGGPDAQLCFNLGNVLAKRGQPARAAERFWQAVELQPDYSEAWNNLGLVLVELGELPEAVRAYREALKSDPAYGNAHYNLADALEQVGRFQEARAHWQTFLRLEPSGDWAAYAKARVAQEPR